MPSITTDDGVRLSYTEHGDPNGRPVVLIAGFKAPATTWVYQQKALAKAGYRVISFDRRGHGLSDRPGTGASMAGHGDDLAALLDTLDLHGVVLVGGSMGGNTIWAYVDRHGTDRLRGVVIVDQTPKMLNTADWPYGFYDYDESNRDTFFADSVPNPGRHSLASKGPVRFLRMLGAFNAREPRELTAPDKELLASHAKADWRDVIARTDVPALFVAGRQSELWPAEHAAASARLAPRGESVVIERDGHAANIEQPGRFNSILIDFLGRA
ncbi:alpha/beta fold hydrolase [Herbiconiux sp. L3-i23]|uniref:alpha/beta fold hydrolase n=1 Tax=Herbiconiux sp. L3-i23 TaxID=2905871 RepID=UPI0020642B10|nr:alpha/beta hydrolase [Herbiconiux sp. L3-i23]BDI23115.1 alpha/beta hydrolase [Herbiconiux sp. L3-i23]